jgi:AraC-like DNA-binding protein
MTMQADTQDRLSPRRGLAWTACYGPDTWMPMHCDGRSRLSLVLAGRIRETAGREEASPNAFGVALKKADALHATSFGPEGARIASINLDAFAAVDPEAFGFASLPPWRWVPGKALLPEIRNAIAAIVSYRRFHDLPESRDALREATVLLTDGIRRGSPTEAQNLSPWLGIVRERIDDAPDEPVSVAALAKLAGVSPTHLTRRFRAAYGLSVTAYRNLRRVQLAVHRLAEPAASLVDVAVESGFHDQSHFSHHFRNLTGTTPGAWRGDLLAA